MSGAEWPIDQMVFLCRNYPTMPIKDFKAGLDAYGYPRSIDSIHAKARSMGIDRKVNAGRFDGTNGNPFKPGSNGRPAKLREIIVMQLIERQTVTVAEMAALTGARKSSVWKVLSALRKQGNCHASSYVFKSGGYETVWKVGAGIDEIEIRRRALRRTDPPIDIYKPDPIPRPQLGAWGCVWNTTTPAEKGATAP